MMDIKQSIVGILAKSAKYKYAGTGFFVSGGLILTCAHVVDAAQVANDRIIISIEGREKRLTAEVIFKSEAAELDIAVLKPVDLPEPPPALPLIMSRQSEGHDFKSYGYPGDAKGQGLYGVGKIHNWVQDLLKRDALQISSREITHGFSGCPVWDNELNGVVGMVSNGFDFGLDKKLGEVCFAIPSEVIKMKLNEVAQPEPPLTWDLVHPYGMPPDFTGRSAERKLLTDWLNNDRQHPLLIIRALGGFGKSALCWHWLTHDVNPMKWTKVVWWSFYEGDASFENFLKETLTYLGAPNVEQMNPRQQAELLLRALQNPGILLVMDGFERELRAYGSMGAAYQADELLKDGFDMQDTSRDCFNPYADAFLRSLAAYGGMLRGKVLMTTRLTPRAAEQRGWLLQGCVEHELRAMDKADAVDFFHMQGINGTHTEIENVCGNYGFHPLSLRILAGWIAADRRTPGDISAAARLDVTDDIIQNKHHILEVAFNTLTAAQKKLLGRIACFRAPMEYEALKAVTGSGKGNDFFDESLQMLEKRGLLNWDRKANKYDLHPIVRRYAYDKLTATDRAAAHTRLADYFAAVPQPQKVEKLDDLAPVIELYHHMLRAGKFDEGFMLLYQRFADILLYQFGAYHLYAELLLSLFPYGELRSPGMSKDDYNAYALNALANAYALSGQPRRAVPLFEMLNAQQEKAGNKQNLAIGLGNVADDQMKIGALAKAERNLRRRIDLCREIGDEFREAVGHQELGRVLSYRGVWDEAEQEFSASLKITEKISHVQNQGLTWAYRALRHLLMERAVNSEQLSVISGKSPTFNLQSAIDCARRALELADMNGLGYPVERDYVRAHWLLGAAYHASGDLTQAETHLSEALRRCRAINNVEHEADILLETAKLRHAQGATDESLRLAREALVITERSTYALQGADVHLWLAELALAGKKGEENKALDDKACALAHAKSARQLATGWDEVDGQVVYDTTGEYVYRVAYDEAEAMIRRLEG